MLDKSQNGSGTIALAGSPLAGLEAEPAPRGSAAHDRDRLLHVRQSNLTSKMLPETVPLAFRDWAAHASNAPFKMNELGIMAIQQCTRLGKAALSHNPVIAPKPGDRRFVEPRRYYVHPDFGRPQRRDRERTWPCRAPFSNHDARGEYKNSRCREMAAYPADILIVPGLEAGNMLAKQLTFLSGAAAAGLVLGARVPIILTSRADSASARLASCAVGVLMARAKETV